MANASTLFKEYWQLRMTSAEQRLVAALRLIEHKPTRGSLAEDLIRSTVRTFLPGQWAAHTGFLIDSAQQPTKQVDILIYDQLHNAPVYRDEAVVVLPVTDPRQADGPRPLAIEVKSVLQKDSLFDALENVASVKRADARIVAAVYAYRGFAKPTTLRSHLGSHISALRKRKQFDAALLPDMVCVQEQQVVVTRQSTPEFTLVGHFSQDPVIQSLLTQILNALGVPQLYSLLPRPTYNPTKLFRVK